jgi:hypothetical protein
MRSIFLSHATVDKPVAEVLRNALQDRTPDTIVFLSSRPGHIRSGAEWWGVIQEKLRSSTEYIVLLTPRSIERPWIPFEAGAAWMTERRMFVVSAGELDKTAVPAPLSFFQIASLEDRSELEAFLADFGASVDDADTLRTSIAEAAAGDSHPGSWSGVQVGPRYFAWDDPTLHSLEDRPQIATPDGLIDAIRSLGLEPSYGVPGNLEMAFGRGRMRVFETDRRKWRREVRGVHGKQVLLVHQDD